MIHTLAPELATSERGRLHAPKLPHLRHVIVMGDAEQNDALREEIRQHVSKKLGPTSRPKAVFLVEDLPKTRSGKIMRRLLQDVAEGRGLGDTTTLADASVVEAIAAGAAEAEAD